MMTRFHVRNYKCLKDVDIPLTPIHVLIGQNDSGKTSLLEAMYALFKVDESPDAAFPGDWTGRELVNLAAAEPRIELGAVCSRRTGQVRLPRRPPVLAQGAGIAIIERAGENRDPQRVKAALSRVEMFRFNPQHMALPSSIHPAGNGQSQRFQLDRDGFGLPTLLDDILSFDFEQFGRLRDAFRRYFPHFTNIRLEKIDHAYNRQTHQRGPDSFSDAR